MTFKSWFEVLLPGLGSSKESETGLRRTNPEKTCACSDRTLLCSCFWLDITVIGHEGTRLLAAGSLQEAHITVGYETFGRRELPRNPNRSRVRVCWPPGARPRTRRARNFWALGPSRRPRAFRDVWPLADSRKSTGLAGFPEISLYWHSDI